MWQKALRNFKTPMKDVTGYLCSTTGATLLTMAGLTSRLSCVGYGYLQQYRMGFRSLESNVSCLSKHMHCYRCRLSHSRIGTDLYSDLNPHSTYLIMTFRTKRHGSKTL